MALRLIYSGGRRIVTDDEIWAEIKPFYEQSYREHIPPGFTLRRPEPKLLHEFYEKMLQMRLDLSDHYLQKPFLAKRFQHSRGHVDEIEKRGPYE